MSLLSYSELVELVERGVIENVEHDQINASSIDITIGDVAMSEVNAMGPQIVELSKRQPLEMFREKFSEEAPLTLCPGDFVLVQSQQVFNLPSYISAEYKLKSSMARIGLEHLNAGWCDAGWHGSVLTLELKNMTNYHSIVIRPGDRIGQLVFFHHAAVPADRSYAARGRYNGDKQVQGVKL